jgi:hypothetical protein
MSTFSTYTRSHRRDSRARRHKSACGCGWDFRPYRTKACGSGRRCQAVELAIREQQEIAARALDGVEEFPVGPGFFLAAAGHPVPRRGNTEATLSTRDADAPGLRNDLDELVMKLGCELEAGAIAAVERGHVPHEAGLAQNVCAAPGTGHTFAVIEPDPCRYSRTCGEIRSFSVSPMRLAWWASAGSVARARRGVAKGADPKLYPHPWQRYKDR